MQKKIVLLILSMVMTVAFTMAMTISIAASSYGTGDGIPLKYPEDVNPRLFNGLPHATGTLEDATDKTITIRYGKKPEETVTLNFSQAPERRPEEDKAPLDYRHLIGQNVVAAYDLRFHHETLLEERTLYAVIPTGRSKVYTAYAKNVVLTQGTDAANHTDARITFTTVDKKVVDMTMKPNPNKDITFYTFSFDQDKQLRKEKTTFGSFAVNVDEPDASGSTVYPAKHNGKVRIVDTDNDGTFEYIFWFDEYMGMVENHDEKSKIFSFVNAGENFGGGLQITGDAFKKVQAYPGIKKGDFVFVTTNDAEEITVTKPETLWLTYDTKADGEITVGKKTYVEYCLKERSDAIGTIAPQTGMLPGITYTCYVNNDVIGLAIPKVPVAVDYALVLNYTDASSPATLLLPDGTLHKSFLMGPGIGDQPLVLDDAEAMPSDRMMRVIKDGEGNFKLKRIWTYPTTLHLSSDVTFHYTTAEGAWFYDEKNKDKYYVEPNSIIFATLPDELKRSTTFATDTACFKGSQLAKNAYDSTRNDTTGYLNQNPGTTTIVYSTSASRKSVVVAATGKLQATQP